MRLWVWSHVTVTAQKMKFFIKDLITFTEEMEVGVSVIHFLVNFSRVSSELLAIKNPKNHIRTNDGFHKNNGMQILTAWVKSWRIIFRTHSNVYDEAFLQKQITAFSRWIFSQRSSFVDVWLGSKYASVYWAQRTAITVKVTSSTTF